MEQELSKEIISAEIVFSQQNDMSKIALPENKYSQELSSINESLEKYANHADRYDYMVAVASSSLLKKVEKDQGKMSMAGMLCAVLGECMNTKADGIFHENEETGEAAFDISKAFSIFGGIVVTALLEWLTADKKPADIDNSDFPEAIKKILHQLNDHPKVRKFLKNPRIPDITTDTLKKLGVPALFIEIVKPKLPKLNESLKNVKSTASDFVHSKRGNLKNHEIPAALLGKAGNQALAVFANEIFVRSFYFIRHLMMEMDRCGDIESVDWSNVIPFDNKTVTRMMSVASLTFTAADMTSAAVRAAIESGGNAILFKTKYAANINVIGVGRAIIAVTKDVSMEWQEADLIRERRILMEKISAEQVEAILAYRKQIEAVVEEYLAEDLQAFLTGADEIEKGLEINDSDRVIHGNVTIQRVLGRKPQFTNQKEFDDLMDSMDALVL